MYSLAKVRTPSLIGIGLAVAILILFLRAAGPTLIVAAAVPVSLLATLFVMHLGGQSLNLMTLGGLALGISTNVANSLGTINAAGTANADVSGINLTGSLMLPVHERVSLFGRLGVLAWQADITGSVSGTVTSAGRRVGISETLSTDASGADLSYGFGALFGVTDTVSIRGNFSRYEIADINVFSIDVVFFPK